MTIKLLNVAKYYEGLPHQKEALEYLQSRIDDESLKKFAQIWRTPSTPVKVEEEIDRTENEPKNTSIIGLAYKVNINDPVIEGGSFTWSEFTKGGSRLPRSAKITNNIIKVATELETVRELLGNKPLYITSAYRPPEVNAAVGGASKSTHLDGLAVDFYAPHLTVDKAFNILLPVWRSKNKGGLAYRKNSNNPGGWGFIHLDLRGYFTTWPY